MICKGWAQPVHINPQSTALNNQDSLVENLLLSRPQLFANILNKRKELRVQIVYTQIDRNANNEPSFTTHYFNIDSSVYFYPASTVKLPVALLALQKIHELSLPGLTLNSTLITESAYPGQTPVYNDPSTPDGRPTVAQYVRKIFMVSDNDAFNRLYEFMGQGYINERLHKMGYVDAEILHRLQISMSPDQNRHTNPIGFYETNGHVLYTQPMQVNDKLYSQRMDSAGHAYYQNDQMVNHAMDFSGKNRISLNDLTEILKAALFPQSVPVSEKFNFNADDLRFIRQYLSQTPNESTWPPYSADTSNYWPAFCKFLFYGSQKGPLLPNIRIFNKVGDAYGFLSDIAYLVDFTNQVEFMLSARIYCNADEVINDDKYDYDAVGFPFMRDLGRTLYEYELKRPRKIKPDLSVFRMTYDK